MPEPQFARSIGAVRSHDRSQFQEVMFISRRCVEVLRVVLPFLDAVLGLFNVGRVGVPLCHLRSKIIENNCSYSRHPVYSLIIGLEVVRGLGDLIAPFHRNIK